MRIIATTLSALMIFALAEEALAQGGGGSGGGMGGGRGGRGGREEWRNRRVQWASNLEDAQSKAGKEKSTKAILVYVFAEDEEERPTEFDRNREVGTMSREEAVFVEYMFTEDDPWLKRWGVKRPGTLVGIDAYGNAFSSTARVSQDNIKKTIEAADKGIEALEAKLRKLAKGMYGDNERKAAVAILKMKPTRWGYEQINTALDVFRNSWKREQFIINLLEGTDGTKTEMYLSKMMRAFSRTPLEYLARIEEARQKHTEKPSIAISDLKKIMTLEPLLFAPEVTDAQAALQMVVKVGEARVQTAVDNKDTKMLRSIQKDYKGTAAGDAASDALKSLR